VSRMMTIPVSERAERRATRLATLTRQRVEDVLTGWLDWAATEVPVEMLPDDELLALCNLAMDEEQQQELSRLLAGNREGALNVAEQAQLDGLMQTYRHGLVRKARAIHVSVQRGLQPPLGAVFQ